MNSHLPAPTDWVAAGALGLTAISLIALALAFADADAGYFDPRRLITSGRLDPLLIVIGPALAAIRDTALDVAALAILLTTSPKGAMTA